MSEDKGKISRRDFFKGAAMGVLGGTALGMGLFSYVSPGARTTYPKCSASWRTSASASLSR